MAEEIADAFRLQQALSPPEVTITGARFESQDELQSYLHRVADHWRLLGQEQEHTTVFYAIVDRRNRLDLGFASLRGRLGPAIVSSTPAIWMVGYNHDVTSLSAESLEPINHIRYQSTFLAFANDKLDEPYLAIVETGVVAPDMQEHKLIWDKPDPGRLDYTLTLRGRQLDPGP